MHRVCVKSVGLFNETVCVELGECVSVGDLIMKVLSMKEVKVSLEAVVVSNGLKTLKLSEDACSYEELIVYRLFRGG